MKTSKEIRNEFIEFFKSKDHIFVPSSPVVPLDDPTLLFTNAGMNQFKDIFLGKGTPPHSRVANSQKCIRVSGKHNDLEEVGHDTYHHTFFEMLGNWSFGDYYKKEAIEWAWELLTRVWKLPKDKLYATVFLEDDEAAELWPQVTEISAERVLRFGHKDNFWEMGETGPCGPCSEIHIDLGPDRCDKQHLPDHQCQVNGECGRFIELWNLVFIQYNRDESGKLTPLPSKHVDTGMGFERIVSVLQNTRSNYETDLFKPIIEEIGRIVGLNFSQATADQKVAFQVISDHIRMLTFAITDGALPSNEGRGYVLRRILRRAARYARKLEIHYPFIYQLVPVVVDVMGEAFPEIKERQKHVQEVIRSEEENFNKTLDRGIEIFDELVKKLKAENKHMIPGSEAFRLYDTYGFPLDLTRIMAEEHHLTIDEEGFDRAMEEQRERARQAGKFTLQFNHVDNWNVLHHCTESSHFVGYDTLETETKICKFAKMNGHYHIVLVDTPFYAESGGQVADKGKIILENIELDVVDVRKEGNDIIHVCRAPSDLKIVHSPVIARVDPNTRYPTMYNHTATHLLHAALRRVLGDHVQQAGSLVAPDRLRFDFTHFKKIEPAELEEIERIVNEQIRRDTPLEIIYTDFNKAKEMGAMALFGEKYGEQVRVISIEGFSRELCGGTHVRRTGEIGSFIIIQETSIASGVRRIEALTGPKAIEFMQKTRSISFEVSRILNSSLEEVVVRTQQLAEQVRELTQRIENLETQQLLDQVDQMVGQAEHVGEIRLVIKEFQNMEIDLLKQAADRFRQITRQGVMLLINHAEGKLNFICAVTDDLIRDKGIKAGELVKEVAKITGGGGGGRPHLATAGGRNLSKLNLALKHLKAILKENL
ncbi:MAG: alanine--tRNA ligase [Calditrichia bacterium]